MHSNESAERRAAEAIDVLRRARRHLDQADNIRSWIAQTNDGQDPHDQEGLTQLKDELRDTLSQIPGLNQSPQVLDDAISIHWSQRAARKNPDKNRWANVLPWDHSMLPGPYLNASTLPNLPSSLLPVTATQPFVATQSPLPNTFADFYAQIYASRATILVNLTPQWDTVGSQKMRKGHRYWPPPEKGTSQSDEMDVGQGWKVKLLSHQTDTTLLQHMKDRGFDAQKDWRIVKRRLQVTPPSTWSASHEEEYAAALSTNKPVSSSSTAQYRLPRLKRADGTPNGPAIIDMIHVEHWSDGGDADRDNFTRLVDLVCRHRQEQEDQLHLTSASSSPTQSKSACRPPIWVHCSAGIGRTGTLIGGLIARDILRSGSGDGRNDDNDDDDDDDAKRRRQLLQECPSLELTLRIWAHVRDRRSGAITTAEQAMMIYTEIERLKQAASSSSQ